MYIDYVCIYMYYVYLDTVLWRIGRIYMYTYVLYTVYKAWRFLASQIIGEASIICGGIDTASPMICVSELAMCAHVWTSCLHGACSLWLLQSADVPTRSPLPMWMRLLALLLRPSQARSCLGQPWVDQTLMGSWVQFGPRVDQTYCSECINCINFCCNKCKYCVNLY